MNQVEDSYTCAICGECFEKEWSEEEAVAEKEYYFGNVPLEECIVMCDDCWQGYEVPVA